MIERNKGKEKVSGREISWEKENAVKSISIGKAPGPDELTVDMIKVAEQVRMQWLYQMDVMYGRGYGQQP